jgi:hypothetical protein
LKTRRSGSAALWTAHRVMLLPTLVFMVFAFALWPAIVRMRSPTPLVALWFLLSAANAALCILGALRHLREDFRELAAQHAAGAPLAPVAAVAQ